MKVGVSEMMIMLVAWILPLAVVGWLFSLLSRGVRALESIAESLRQQQHRQ